MARALGPLVGFATMVALASSREAVAQSASAAQKQVATPPGTVDLRVPVRDELTLEEMVTHGEALRAHMQNLEPRLAALIGDARQKKDIVRINCLTDKAVQLRASLSIADKSHSLLKEAAAKDDRGRALHEYTRLVIVNQNAQVLAGEAEACVGEDLSYVGATRVDVEASGDGGSPDFGGGGPDWAVAAQPTGGGLSRDRRPLRVPYQPTWNVWAERTERTTRPRFAPARHLRVGADYLLVVDLAAIPYHRFNLASQAAGTRVAEALAGAEGGTVDFTLHVLPDPKFFEGGTAEVPFRAKVPAKTSYEAPIDPMAFLAAHGGNGEFNLGRVAVPLRTRRGQGGLASISVAVWRDGTPIDELDFHICMAGDADSAKQCQPAAVKYAEVVGEGGPTDPIELEVEKTRAASSDASGIDPRDAAKRLPKPDVAFHIMAGDPMQGLLKIKGLPTMHWMLDGLTPAELRRKWDKTIVSLADLGSPSGGDTSLLGAAGEELFDRLFPREQIDPRNGAWVENVARREFTKLVRKVAADRGRPPRVIARLASLEGGPFLIPLGLMAIGADDAYPERLYVGDHLDIEVPLRKQRYGNTDHCPEGWTVVAPKLADLPKVDDLAPALQRARLEVDPAPDWSNIHLVRNLDELFEQPKTKKAVAPATLLMILSHHENDQIYWTKQRPYTFGKFAQHYAEPSVVILNGCSTGVGGGTSVLSDMQRHGFHGAVATATRVGGQMAGDYAVCFRNEIMNLNGRQATLSEVHWRAVRCVAKQDIDVGEHYGPRALTYMLIGDGGVPLCRLEGRHAPQTPPVSPVPEPR
jgi:hypothetical protein